IVGSELTMSREGPGAKAQGHNPEQKKASSLGPWALGRGPDHWTPPVLVASATGYKNLCRVITRAKLKAPKGEMALALEDFTGCTTGLIALAGRPALDA